MNIYKTKNNKYRLEFNKSKLNAGYVLEFFCNDGVQNITNLNKEDVIKMLDFINKKEGVL